MSQNLKVIKKGLLLKNLKKAQLSSNEVVWGVSTSLVNDNKRLFDLLEKGKLLNSSDFSLKVLRNKELLNLCGSSLNIVGHNLYFQSSLDSNADLKVWSERFNNDLDLTLLYLYYKNIIWTQKRLKDFNSNLLGSQKSNFKGHLYPYIKFYQAQYALFYSLQILLLLKYYHATKPI